MQISSIQSNMPATSSADSTKSIEVKIKNLTGQKQSTENELNKLKGKIQLSDEDKKKKKELEQKEAKLEQQIESAKQEKTQKEQKAEQAKKKQQDSNAIDDPTASTANAEAVEVMEPGKGESVDTYL